MPKKTPRAADALKEKLGEKGSHLTRQRVAVFSYLARVTHHPTAEEIYHAVKRELPRISLATVYKNLEKLVECGAASKLAYGDAAARYDSRTDHHFHTRCLACGRMQDFDAANGTELLRQIKPRAGFTVEDYRLELIGYCRGCRR